MSAQRSRDTCSRSQPRLKVFRLACAQAGGVQFKIHLLDISERGARIHAGEVPGRAVRITLACASVITKGEVRWVDASRFGLKFDEPLLPLDLDAIVGGN
jgi:hypothetical protein